MYFPSFPVISLILPLFEQNHWEATFLIVFFRFYWINNSFCPNFKLTMSSNFTVFNLTKNFSIIKHMVERSFVNCIDYLMTSTISEIGPKSKRQFKLGSYLRETC